MHYVTSRSHQMKKHKFNVICPGVLFVESPPVPPEHKKYCAYVSRPRRPRIHYITRRSYRMQKHKFSVTCLRALFMETTLSMKNSALMFHAPNAQECTTCPTDPTRCLPKFSVMCPGALFVETATGPPEQEK
jgi:hypothetical protein